VDGNRSELPCGIAYWGWQKSLVVITGPAPKYTHSDLSGYQGGIIARDVGINRELPMRQSGSLDTLTLVAQ
jgi:hypothetical protein